MAQAQTQRYSALYITLGDGESVEAFTKLCGLESKSFGITNNTNSSNIPDCADEDLPSFEEEDIVSQSMPLSGEGFVTSQQHQMMLAWAADGEIKNIRAYPGLAPVTGDIVYFAGPAFLKEYTVTGSRGDKLKANIAFGWNAKPTRFLKAA